MLDSGWIVAASAALSQSWHWEDKEPAPHGVLCCQGFVDTVLCILLPSFSIKRPSVYVHQIFNVLLSKDLVLDDFAQV